MVSAIRYLYRFAVQDHHLDTSTAPSVHLDKPRRLPGTRRAPSAHQLTQINHVAATTGDDPDLDTLVLRIHLETTCRTASALTLRGRDPIPTNARSDCQAKTEPCTGSPSPPH
ncbi:hypothetical protein OG225_06040 [Nocardia sp. NBC_01377]|uniref:hypothetical protein n=1 Tax=Nocardia sp. NBC_01377 TaxID=2903595 RepID=UPI003246D3E8